MTQQVANQSDELRKGMRVAKNTVVLFLRMFVLMLVNLYAVRVLIRSLGVSDYGVFQAVAGVVTTLTCLNSVLSASTQRFYNYAIGKGTIQDVGRIFSISVNINVVFSVVILLLFETVGIWFLNTQMMIPETRMLAANHLFQFSIFSFLCTILQIPFMAALMAHEDMGWYALISTVECLARLLVAMTIGLTTIDHLAYYGGGLMVVSVVIMMMYVVISKRRYKELLYVRVKDFSLYKKLLSFSGWTLFGSLASVGMFQGNNILLNIFFGAITNAAYGIAFQINNAFNSLCNSIVLAFRPLMVQTVARGDHAYIKRLFMVSSKFIFYIMLLVIIPIYYGMPYILDLWLDKEVTPEMVLFSRLIMIYILIMSLHHPITIVMQAKGKVKVYHLVAESIMLLCLPLSYLLFRCGWPAWVSYLSMIIVTSIAHIARLFVIKHECSWFSFSWYFFNLLSGIGIKQDEREMFQRLIRKGKNEK